MFSWLFKRPPAPTPYIPSPPSAASSPPELAPGRDLVERALAGTPKTLRASVLERYDAMLPPSEAPPDQAAWRGFLADIRRRRWRDSAFAVAESLCQALPSQRWPVLELALLCGPATDQLQALAVGQRAYASAPDNPAGPRLILNALRALRRGAEASAFLDGLPGAFGSEDWYLIGATHIAWGRGDLDRVLDYAVKLQAVAPGCTVGFTMASAVYRQRREPDQAEAVIAQALETLPESADVWGEAARVAQTSDNHVLAFERWAELRRRFPRSPAGYIGAIQLSQRVGQPAETDALAAEGVRAFPKNRDLQIHAARTAMQIKDMDKAGQHWQAAIASAPADAALQMQAAIALLGTGAERKRRTPAAIEVLAGVNDKFPEYVPACVSRLKLLRGIGRFDEAQEVGAAWARRFPADPSLAVARARIAEILGDMEASIAHIAEVRALATRSGMVEAAYVRALSVAGQHQAADEACAAALAELPGDIDLLCEYPTLAIRRGDWEEALRRAQASVAANHGHHRLRQVLERVRIQAVAADEPAPAEKDTAASPPARGETGAAAFLSRFESLGATAAGCEFGIVQRRFGAEPLGLLRWAKIDLDGLLTALANDFNGIGAPENTQLLIRSEGANYQEYYVEDSRLGYSTHTFVTVEDTSFDRMLKQSLRRLVFLRSKLLEDLRVGEKIFVYKLGRKQAATANLIRLHDAMRRFSKCTLLCVTLEDEVHPKGMLEMLRSGLFLGRAATVLGEGGAGIDTEQWRIFCEQVAAWQDASRVEVVEPAVA